MRSPASPAPKRAGRDWWSRAETFLSRPERADLPGLLFLIAVTGAVFLKPSLRDTWLAMLAVTGGAILLLGLGLSAAGILPRLDAAQQRQLSTARGGGGLAGGAARAGSGPGGRSARYVSRCCSGCSGTRWGGSWPKRA